MKLVDKTIGIVGVLAFIFSLVYYSIRNIWDTINWITLAAGIVGMAFYVALYYKTREKKISTRTLQYGSNIVIQSVAVIAIIGLLAFISQRQNLRIDWTENQLYSLADQTEKVLDGLDKDVNILAFYKTTEEGRARDLLDEYTFLSGNLTTEFVDPDEEPNIARKYQIQQYNTVVVESGNKREVIDELTEANLTNAIMKVTREQDKVIYFLTGHGERSISDETAEGYKQAADAIKNENHLVRELNLVRRMINGQGIPDSCTVLAVVSPKANFFPGEVDSISAYLDRGGKVLLLLDPPERSTEMEALAERYHLTIGRDMVIDGSGVGRLFGAGPGMPLVTNYNRDIPITKDFSVMTFYPYASSVTPMEDKGGYDIRTILETGENSWAETDLSSREVSFDPAFDIKGPVSIAALVEKKTGDKKTSLVVYGDSDFAKNGFWRNQGNADLFLNTINYLADEEDLISIRPKDVDDRRITLTQADVTTVFYLVVIAIPLLVVVAGVLVYNRRRK